MAVSFLTRRAVRAGAACCALPALALPGKAAGRPIVVAQFHDTSASEQDVEVLTEIEAPLTRASALAAFQRRQDEDSGGYRVSFNRQRRSAAFVTQSMLTADGRVVG